MNIGFMSTYDPERIAFAKQHGFGSVELIVSDNTDFLPGRDGWESKAAEMVAAYQEAGIRISCIAGFYDNILSDDAAERKAMTERVGTVVELAEAIDVGVVGGFSGRLRGRPLEESIAPFAEAWSGLAKLAEDHGVKIAFENCPMGRYHTPANGINVMCTPEMWRRGFEAVGSEAIGLEWDPSHLICLVIDPVANLREFGTRVYHVHAKDARVNRDVVQREGFWYPDAIEHCFPGLGDTDWGGCIKELLRQGYASDLNIEGWHDGVYNDRDGAQREDTGLLIGLRHLSQFV